MAEFSPFRGVRYDRDRLGTDLGPVAAPPYDVIDDDHRVALEAHHPHNAVRLILPQDPAADVARASQVGAGDAPAAGRYAAAAALLAAWRADGMLQTDDSARYYGYRMDFTGPHGEARHTIGVLGALSLPARPGEGDILPHERTLPKAKSDRLDLLRATRMNLDPIWGLSPAAGLTELIDTSVELCSANDEVGNRHRLFAIDDPARIAAISTAVAGAPLVLADGHHRFETACTYRDQRRADRSGDVADPGADAILCFVVELVDHELCIQAIHRLVALTPGTDVVARLADAFDVRAFAANTPDAVDEIETAMHDEGGIGLAWGDRLLLATPRREVTDPALAASEPEAVRGTDAALIEAVVVDRLGPAAEWTYRHDLHEVAALAAKTPDTLGLLLRPVSVADTRAAAVAGVRMPQKTTFFYPKPRTGMVFRSLDA